MCVFQKHTKDRGFPDPAKKSHQVEHITPERTFQPPPLLRLFRFLKFRSSLSLFRFQLEHFPERRYKTNDCKPDDRVEHGASFHLPLGLSDFLTASTNGSNGAPEGSHHLGDQGGCGGRGKRGAPCLYLALIKFLGGTLWFVLFISLLVIFFKVTLVTCNFQLLRKLVLALLSFLFLAIIFVVI